MKNYFRITLWVAILTACCIFTFQTVWVYRTYKASEENFRIKSAQALMRSVDQYLLEQIPSPVSLTGPAPSLSIINRVSQKGTGDISNNLKTPFKNTGPVSIAFHSLQIDTANLENVRLFVAQMTVLSNKQKLEIPVVERYFRKELAREGVTVDFSLSLEKRQPNQAEQAISVSLGQSKGDWVILALPKGKGWHLLGQNIEPALISLSLILLTAGCLWYMALIIVRQRKLDQTKNDFIDNLAHELRTPVSILKTTNEALLDFGQAYDVEKTNRYLHFNAEVLSKLENGIDRLLRIRQYELGAKTVQLSNVNLQELFYEVISTFQISADNKITISVEPTDKTIRTDKEMIKDIFANLLDNALKYANGPAVITVKAYSVNKGWQLVLEDNGIGIEKDNLPFIFDKFYRVGTGNVHDVKGYGIGLSYVKQLVKQLHGEIEVSSEKEKGATFIITFLL